MLKALGLVCLVPVPEGLHIAVEGVSAVSLSPQHPREPLKCIVHIQAVTLPLIVGIQSVERRKLRVAGVPHTGGGIKVVEVKSIFLQHRIEVRRQLLPVILRTDNKVIERFRLNEDQIHPLCHTFISLAR